MPSVMLFVALFMSTTMAHAWSEDEINLALTNLFNSLVKVNNDTMPQCFPQIPDVVKVKLMKVDDVQGKIEEQKSNSGSLYYAVRGVFNVNTLARRNKLRADDYCINGMNQMPPPNTNVSQNSSGSGQGIEKSGVNAVTNNSNNTVNNQKSNATTNNVGVAGASGQAVSSSNTAGTFAKVSGSSTGSTNNMGSNGGSGSTNRDAAVASALNDGLKIAGNSFKDDAANVGVSIANPADVAENQQFLTKSFSDVTREQNDLNQMLGTEQKMSELGGELNSSTGSIIESSQKALLFADDAQALADKQNALSRDEAFIAQVEATLLQIKTAALAAFPVNTTCETAAVAAAAEIKSYKATKNKCSTDAADASQLCSMIRSKEALAVQSLMIIGTKMINNLSSAERTCRVTSSISLVGQVGMTAANVHCSIKKFSCDSSCGSADKILSAVATKLSSCPMATSLVQRIRVESTVLNSQQIAQCKKHSLDIAQFGAQALGLASAYKDAKDCRTKLASINNAGGTGGVAGQNLPSNMTMSQFCQMAQNAQTTMCKCANNSSAPGCMGAASNSGFNAPKVVKSGSGVSGMAIAGNASGLDHQSGTNNGLSDEAKKALGINSGANSGLAPNATVAAAAGTNNSNASQSSESTPNDATQAQSKNEKGISLFGYDFSSGLGGIFGGSKKIDNDKLSQFKELNGVAIQRQIASEKARSEVTFATGKTNWDKVRARYNDNNKTLFVDSP